MRVWSGQRVAALLLCAAAAACGSSAPDAAPPDVGYHMFELYSWLSAGREYDALNGLYDLLRKRDPKIHIVGSASYGGNPYQCETALPQCIAEGHPPDSFQLTGGGDFLGWARTGRLAPLDALAAEQGWANVFPKPVLDSVSAGGMLQAVPMNIERDNTLFYDKALLSSSGVTPPKTIAELFSAAKTLRAKGVEPLSISARGGWSIAPIVFESVLVAEAGANFYTAYLSGQLSGDAPQVRAALTDVAMLLDYANADRGTIGWGEATDRICTGKSAMLLMPDFAKGRLDVGGCLSPDRIGYVALQPARSPTFVFWGMGFPLPKEAAHPRTAIEFLEVVGSKEGQEVFNRKKISLPARTDVDLTGFDFISVQEFTDWTAPGERLVPAYAALTSSGFQEVVNDALQRFADPASPDHKNVEKVLAVLAAHYGIIRP